MPKVSFEQLNHLSWCSLNMNIWCFEYVENETSEKLLGNCSSSILRFKGFLDHSSVANLYQHLILNWKIYNLYKFFEKNIFCKKVLTEAVSWLSRVSPSNFGFRTNERTVPSFILLPLSKVSHMFFQLTYLTIQSSHVPFFYSCLSALIVHYISVTYLCWGHLLLKCC